MNFRLVMNSNRETFGGAGAIKNYNVSESYPPGTNELEASTAHKDRPPMRIEKLNNELSLVDFLRKEYYRRLGIYIVGDR